MTLPIPKPPGEPNSTQKIKSQWTNNLTANVYKAPVGQMFFDTYDGVLRLGDGSTPGGIIIGGGGGGNGVPALPANSIQFNNGGVFGGNIALTFDAANSALSLTGLATVTGNIAATDTITAGNAVIANVITAQNGLLLNANTVVHSFTIEPGYNAVSGGPVEIPDGVIVDSVNGRWTIV